jgi:ABC-type multidrug transport system fused ATPase/permease subunit
MEEGYDTILGEGGVDISGGQKQRLAIARGLLCNASIFVLDEATSALDNNTQSKVLEAIKNIGENHTVLLIAHRLSTVVDADVIFYIGEGKVIGSGKHDELLANCEEYRKLYHAEASA